MATVADPAPDECRGPAPWCPLDGLVHLDGAKLEERYAVGDMAAGLVIADAWAEVALIRAGLPSSPSTVRCLTGVWLGTTFPDATQRRSRSVLLSPGDLDEVAFTILTAPHEDPIAALRSTLDGFSTGLGGCIPLEG